MHTHSATIAANGQDGQGIIQCENYRDFEDVAGLLCRHTHTALNIWTCWWLSLLFLYRSSPAWSIWSVNGADGSVVEICIEFWSRKVVYLCVLQLTQILALFISILSKQLVKVCLFSDESFTQLDLSGCERNCLIMYVLRMLNLKFCLTTLFIIIYVMYM